MNRLKKYSYGLIVFAIIIFLSKMDSRADDTCMFSVTADDVPPNIVLLLDNGAEMQQVQWHATYDDSIGYTPTAVFLIPTVTAWWSMAASTIFQPGPVRDIQLYQ